MDNKRQVDFENIRDYSLNPEEESVSVFFSLNDNYAALPEEDKDQLFFLNREANDFLHHYFALSYGICDPIELTTGFPYVGNHFKKHEFKHRYKGQALKKWLYQRGIPFSKWVYVIQYFSIKHPMLMTWKMVIKYSDRLFQGDDFSIFDETTQWCIKYDHDDYIFYNEMPFKDTEEGYKELDKMNARKKKFPKYKHPYLDD